MSPKAKLINLYKCTGLPCPWLPQLRNRKVITKIRFQVWKETFSFSITHNNQLTFTLYIYSMNLLIPNKLTISVIYFNQTSINAYLLLCPSLVIATPLRSYTISNSCLCWRELDAFNVVPIDVTSCSSSSVQQKILSLTFS